MREEGLAPSRRPFENGTNYTRVIFQILMSMLSSTYLNQMEAHNLLHTSELFDQQSSCVRIGLKMTPI